MCVSITVAEALGTRRGSSPAGRRDVLLPLRRSRTPAMRVAARRPRARTRASPRPRAKSAQRARRVAAEQIEHEALEVRRLRDVHRRARRLVRLGGAAHAVDAGAEELVEHVVLVGGERPAARSAAPSCARRGRRRCCRSCPTARRSRPRSSLRLGRLEVAGEVVDDLRQQARPVDRVDRADRVPCA